MDFRNVMSGLKIPYVNLPRQYESIKEELLNAQNAVYTSGRVLDGEQVTNFESEMAKRCQRKYAIAVNSCTQALIFSNMMTNLHNDSCVVMPAISFIATLNSVLMSGRHPRFTDVDDQGLIDVSSIDKCDAHTLLFVDLYGNIPNPEKFKSFEDWYIIEDAAQSFGSYYDGQPAGTFGHVSCLSFDPMKNLPNYGSGGMILTDEPQFNMVARDLRDNGKFGGSFGTNSKMSESDCAGMLVKLKHFDGWQQRRKDIANYYSKNLKHVEVPNINPSVSPNWHKYVIQTDDRAHLQLYLSNIGIESKVHYPYTLGPHQNAYKLSQRVLSLPIYPELTDTEVEAVVQAINVF